MPRLPSARCASAAAALMLLAGCAGGLGGGGTPPLREPGFRPSMVRRPALLVRVSVSDDLSDRERRRVPEDYQAAVVEGFERQGLLVVDLAVAPGGRSRPLDGLDRAGALARARQAGAEHLVIVDARLSRGDLPHCRETARTVSGPTTYWDAGMEILRVSDGRPLYIEPPGEDLRVVDVELECKTRKLIRRKSMDELIEESTWRIVAPFAPR